MHSAPYRTPDVILHQVYHDTERVKVPPVTVLSDCGRRITQKNWAYYAYHLARWDSALDQGSSNLSLGVQSAAEFSSDPDQTHLPVIF